MNIIGWIALVVLSLLVLWKTCRPLRDLVNRVLRP